MEDEHNIFTNLVLLLKAEFKRLSPRDSKYEAEQKVLSSKHTRTWMFLIFVPCLCLTSHRWFWLRRSKGQRAARLIVDYQSSVCLGDVKQLGDERYVKKGRRLKKVRHRKLKMRNRIHCEQKCEY